MPETAVQNGVFNQKGIEVGVADHPGAAAQAQGFVLAERWCKARVDHHGLDPLTLGRQPVGGQVEQLDRGWGQGGGAPVGRRRPQAVAFAGVDQVGRKAPLLQNARLRQSGQPCANHDNVVDVGCLRLAGP